MKKGHENKSVISNFLWRLAENWGAQFVTLLVSIILARILDPDVYGIVAIVNIFITILLVFVNQGLGNALIQKKDADHLDFSSVFYASIVLSLVLYAIVFFCAPLVSWYFNEPQITPILRVLGTLIIISSVKSVEFAYVSRNMMFRKFFFSTLTGTIISAVVGIVMAINGFGVWALVSQSLINPFIDTIFIWFSIDWRPKKEFSFQRLKGLFSYGWKLLVSSLIDRLYGNLRSFIIGKKHSTADLAYYNKGDSWPRLFTDSVNGSIDSVLLPVMAQAQNDREEVKAITRRAIKTSSFVMTPFLIGLCAVSTPLVRLLLTEKWMDSVFYMRIFCISYVLYPLHTANLNAIKAIGESGTYLKMEIVKKILQFVILIIAVPFGIRWLAVSALFCDILCTLINSFPNRKLIGYKYKEQLRDIAPAYLLSAVMGVLVFLISLIGLPDIVTLLIQIAVGVVVYVAGAFIFRFEAIDTISEKFPFIKKITQKVRR